MPRPSKIIWGGGGGRNYLFRAWWVFIVELEQGVS